MRDQADTPPTEGSSARRTKDRLLLLLKTRGPQTTKALAAALGWLIYTRIKDTGRLL